MKFLLLNTCDLETAVLMWAPLCGCFCKVCKESVWEVCKINGIHQYIYGKNDDLTVEIHYYEFKTFKKYEW